MLLHRMMNVSVLQRQAWEKHAPNFNGSLLDLWKQHKQDCWTNGHFMFSMSLVMMKTWQYLNLWELNFDEIAALNFCDDESVLTQLVVLLLLLLLTMMVLCCSCDLCRLLSSSSWAYFNWWLCWTGCWGAATWSNTERFFYTHPFLILSFLLLSQDSKLFSWMNKLFQKSGWPSMTEMINCMRRKWTLWQSNIVFPVIWHDLLRHNTK